MTTASRPAAAGSLAPGRWAVTACTATFRARDLLGRPVVGTLPLLSGEVEVDRHGVPARVSAELDLTGVDTGNARRDKDLQGPRFFDSTAGGVLRFTADRPATTAGDGWLLDGTLQLRDTDCPVQLSVEPAGGPGRRVRATTALDRRDLGITVPAVLVRPRIEITVEAELLPPR